MRCFACSFQGADDVVCLVVTDTGTRSSSADTLQQRDDVRWQDLAATLAVHEGVGGGAAADDGDAGRVGGCDGE